MPTLIPDKLTKAWNVSPNGDLFGNLIRTRNVDFNKRGYLALAKKPAAFFSTLEHASFLVPLCIQCDNTTAYVITTGGMFTFSTGGPAPTGLRNNGGTPPSFGFPSDGCFYLGIFHASGTQTVGSLASVGGNWTERITGLSTSYPHPVCNSEHQQYLAVGDGNTVKLYDGGASYSLIRTLTIPSNLVVEWIRWRSNILYIGTRAISGGDAKLILWDGSGTGANASYSAGCDWIYSGCEYDSSIAIVTSTGQILRFNGGGFDEIANFPVYYKGLSWSSPSSTSNLVGKVASRGMIAKGRRLYLNIDGAHYGQGGGVTDYIPEQPGGAWVYDPDVGLYHKGGLDNFTVQDLEVSSVSSNVLTFGSSITYATGDPVLCTSKSGLTGVVATIVYYAIRVTSTTMKLAFSAKDAQNGVNITIGGTPNSLDKFRFSTYRSVGATRVERPGGIALVQSNIMNMFNGSEIIFAGQVNSYTASTQVNVICSLGMGKNVGSFITPKIQATGVTDKIKKLIAKFSSMNYDTRKVIVKYRTARAFNLPGRGGVGGATAPYEATWASSNSFTISSANFDISGFAVGNEIEFIEGAAAGYAAHIATIDVSSSPTVTITLDESMPDVSSAQTSYFFVDNWSKYKAVTLADDPAAARDGFKKHTIAGLLKGSKWIQLKVELRGYSDIDEGTEIEEIAVINEQDQKYN